MAIKAYILVETEASITPEIISEIREVEGVKEADSVSGPYDIVITVQVNTIDDITPLLRLIRSTPGISKTTTLIKLG